MTITVTAQGSSASISIKRPRFSDLWKAYPKKSSAEEAYRQAGGIPLALYLENSTAYENACAIRLSHSFNEGNFPLTKQKLSSVKNAYAQKGANGKPYLFRVNDMIKYVTNQLGKPDIELIANGTNQSKHFAGMQGIIIFVVKGWGNATGHVTLWNDYECGDKCYFQPNNATLVKILFWRLID
ncbi:MULTISPECIES: type VI secretion system amidase effector protein Tae4 [Neisseria]|uniref:Type VI secretion system amidase effector protein Tae4 n=1 Tax=Neisseria dumasiana TaxID=1931275 RepID=A0A1X3DKS2_9NEIS|nr:MULTISPECIES: type VI secretion system amidase effector protein Tae4 [Neisseria]KPN74829.1 hypothetical protein AKG43_00220 [Neisseria sp. 74A18]OSI15609.1 hypothetical protein BV914_06575 [Neisseria dumasiana]OSI24270.1 hypothetical protein BV912_02715 [Neisseria dumasiana]OSI36634.1 hypothetical protein BV913_01115 [Neisseria dumasiana]UOO85237.1 type VI secretion system amidase effector protein Tae4 [Neisseria dumasiana]